MGIKYHFEVKDHKLDQRFQRQKAGSSAAAKPDARAAKKLTRKQAAKLAAKQAR